MIKQPHHFTMTDFFKALLGSLFVGLIFLFKGQVIDYAETLPGINLIWIFVVTCIIVTIEIYVLSYKFVKDRKARPFREFWAKRFFAIIVASYISLYLIIYLYGLNNILTPLQILKVSTAIFLPAATIGAGIEILKKKIAPSPQTKLVK